MDYNDDERAELRDLIVDKRRVQGRNERRSCLRQLVDDARCLAYRNEEGEPRWTSRQERDALGGSLWTPALLYLVVVEHIGACFTPPAGAGAQFNQALSDFGGIEDETERNALWGLRCGWAHSYSLLNLLPNKAGFQRFVVDWSLSDPLIDPGDYATEAWDQDYGSPRRGHRVNLLRVEELAETMVSKVLKDVDDGRRVPAVSMAEFRLRFTFTTAASSDSEIMSLSALTQSPSPSASGATPGLPGDAV